jgi:hypothetical protein
MEPDALPAWAEAHAAALLAGLDVRWQHVRGVAGQARLVARVLASEDRPYLVAAAWLHDVGYASSLAATGFHPARPGVKVEHPRPPAVLEPSQLVGVAAGDERP